MHALPQCFQSFYRLSQQLFLQTLLSAVLTFQILEGSADFSQKKNGRKKYLAESEVMNMNDLWVKLNKRIQTLITCCFSPLRQPKLTNQAWYEFDITYYRLINGELWMRPLDDSEQWYGDPQKVEDTTGYEDIIEELKSFLR